MRSCAAPCDRPAKTRSWRRRRPHASTQPQHGTQSADKRGGGGGGGGGAGRVEPRIPRRFMVWASAAARGAFRRAAGAAARQLQQQQSRGGGGAAAAGAAARRSAAGNGTGKWGAGIQSPGRCDDEFMNQSINQCVHFCAAALSPLRRCCDSAAAPQCSPLFGMAGGRGGRRGHLASLLLLRGGSGGVRVGGALGEGLGGRSNRVR